MRRIVHHGVEHIARQIGLRVAPDLPEDESLRVDLFDLRPEGPPEREVDLVGYVQPPAVDTHFGPIACHTQQIVPNIRVFGVQLGHMAFKSESLITVVAVYLKGVLIDEVPAVVLGIFTTRHYIAKLREGITGVIEHGIQHNANAAAVTIVQKSAEILQSSQAGIDGEIVICVVTVAGVGMKNRT